MALIQTEYQREGGSPYLAVLTGEEGRLVKCHVREYKHLGRWDGGNQDQAALDFELNSEIIYIETDYFTLCLKLIKVCHV